MTTLLYSQLTLDFIPFLSIFLFIAVSDDHVTIVFTLF